MALSLKAHAFSIEALIVPHKTPPPPPHKCRKMVAAAAHDDGEGCIGELGSH